MNHAVIHLQTAFLVHKTTPTPSSLSAHLSQKRSIDLWLKVSHVAVEDIKVVNFCLLLKKYRLVQSNMEQSKKYGRLNISLSLRWVHENNIFFKVALHK